jgi:RNA polymerase sigma-70 factor (ECF subfamily)
MKIEKRCIIAMRSTLGFTMKNQPSISPSSDEQAEFTQLFSGNELRIKGYVLSLVPNWADAEEIFAETNAKLWKQFDKYDRTKDFGSWACTLAHYEVLTFRTRQKRDKLKFPDEIIDLVAVASSEADDERGVRFRYLLECMDNLDAKSRQLIHAFYSGLETVSEIAKRTASSNAAIYKSVSRSRHRLHVCIDEHLREDEGS